MFFMLLRHTEYHSQLEICKPDNEPAASLNRCVSS